MMDSLKIIASCDLTDLEFGLYTKLNDYTKVYEYM